jgi:two-component system, NarL family, nitrate/nitrite response regulator NarL
MSAYRVLIADDHPPTREQLREILEAESDFDVCAESADAAGAIASAVSEIPDLCILDIRMPGSGVAAAWEITARLPATKVVMLTVSRDDRDLFAALRAGAAGYLLKDIPPAELADELRIVMSGEVALPANLVTRLAAEFRDRAPRRRRIVAGADLPPLTSREWEVLELLRQGATTAVIASTLSVSPATVRSHVGGILHKLRVPDRESAVRLLEASNGTGPDVEPQTADFRPAWWRRQTARTSW